MAGSENKYKVNLEELVVPDSKKDSKTSNDMKKGDRSQFQDWPNDQILNNLSNKNFKGADLRRKSGKAT